MPPTSLRGEWKALPVEERRALQHLIGKKLQPPNAPAEVLDLLAWRARNSAMYMWLAAALPVAVFLLEVTLSRVGAPGVLSGTFNAALLGTIAVFMAVLALRFHRTARAYDDAASKLRARNTA